MKRNTWIALALVMLLLATLACGGGEETEVPATEPPPPPTSEPPPPPTEPPSPGLDYSLAPNFGTVELEAGFLPDPHEEAITSGGAIDVASLSLGSGCTGYATSAPDLRLMWSGQSVGFRVFFVPDDESADATLIINNPSGGWACNDDYSGWNPLVEFDEPDAGQYDIWVGSYSSDEFIAGTLYFTELELGPDDVGSEAGPSGDMASQWASSATASSEYGSTGWSASQATGAPDTEECGDISTAWATATSDGVDWIELTYDVPVFPAEINVYETNSPGFIADVYVFDENGDYYMVWEGTPEAADECPRIFSVEVVGVDVPVVGVLINLDQSDGGYWNEIDAVELVGYY